MATTSFTVTDFTATGNEQILTNQAGAVQVVTNYFPYLKDTDVKVSIKAAGASSYTQKDVVTHWTINDSKNIVFKASVLTASTVYSVLVRRQTDITSPRVTFQSGSAVSASDLNTNSTQFIYAIEELDPNTITATSEITIADDAVTTAKILDDNVTYAKLQDIGTANRVLGKASTGTVEEVQIATNMIADDAITTAKILDDNVTVDKLGNGALPTGITITSANITNDTIVNADIKSDAAIAFSKIATGALPTAWKIVSDNINNITTFFNAIIPSQSGNNGKYLTTNGSATSWGSINTGKLLQIDSETKTGTEYWTNYNNWLDVPGFSASITPASSANKIYVNLSLFAAYTKADSQCEFRLVRRVNSSDTLVGNGSEGFGALVTIGENDWKSGTTLHHSYLDSPTTTSEVTYLVQYRPDGHSSKTWINTNGHSDREREYSSTITAMEIAG